jgi:hypothetical protein
VFFLDLGGKLLAVTAAHVFQGYLDDRAKAPRDIVCHIENVIFNPEVRLVGAGSKYTVDIATFSVTREELQAIGKQVVIGEPWPPPVPKVGEGVFLSGFPAKLRLWFRPNELSFAMFAGLNPVNKVTDRDLTCVLERDYWVSDEGGQLPPDLQDIGGLSGGPVLLPQEANGEWHMRLVAVISTGAFGAVLTAPLAGFINADGTIRAE